MSLSRITMLGRVITENPIHDPHHNSASHSNQVALMLLTPRDPREQLITTISFSLETALQATLTSSRPRYHATPQSRPHAISFLLGILPPSRKSIVKLLLRSFSVLTLYLEEVDPSTRCCPDLSLVVSLELRTPTPEAKYCDGKPNHRESSTQVFWNLSFWMQV